MSALTKQVADDVPSFELIFIQASISLVVILPMVIYGKQWQVASKYAFGLYGMKVVLWIIARILFLYVITLLPLAQMTAISFAEPLFTTSLAIILLGERIGRYRVAGLLVGFIGVLVVIRPDPVTFEMESLWMVLVTLLWAILAINVKYTSRTETALSQLFYTMLGITLCTAPFALANWQTLTMHQGLIIGVISLLFLSNSLLFIKAFQYSDITLLSPFSFTQLLFATAFGYWMFAEIPDGWTMAGAFIILSGVVYVLYRERKTKRAVVGALKVNQC